MLFHLHLRPLILVLPSLLSSLASCIILLHLRPPSLVLYIIIYNYKNLFINLFLFSVNPLLQSAVPLPDSLLFLNPLTLIFACPIIFILWIFITFFYSLLWSTFLTSLLKVSSPFLLPSYYFFFILYILPCPFSHQFYHPISLIP